MNLTWPQGGAVEQSFALFLHFALYLPHRKDFHRAPAVLPICWFSYNIYLHRGLSVHTAHPSRVCLHLIQHHHIPRHDSHQVSWINWIFHYIIPNHFSPSALKHRCTFITQMYCRCCLQHYWVSYCKAGMLRETLKDLKSHAQQLQDSHFDPENP